MANILPRYKVYKEMVRYLKDNGLYSDFIRKLNNYTTHLLNIGYGRNRSDVIKKAFENNPICIIGSVMKNLELSKDFENAYIKNNLGEIKDWFNSFLIRENVFDEYYHNVDFKFIKGHFPESLSYDNPRDLIFKNLAPRLYINYAFAWQGSYQGRDFWLEICEKWEKSFSDFLKK